LLGFFADWYTNDTTKTFWEYLQNLKSVNQVYLLMILLGAAIAFWIGKDSGLASLTRREGRPAAAEAAPQTDQGKAP
jgi:hypothetical protein